MARRSVVDAASQIHRESNHDETRKGDTFWGLNQRWLVCSNHGVSKLYHGGLESNHGVFESLRFTGLGVQNNVRYWTGTPTLADPQIENHVGYLNHTLLAMVFIQRR